MERERNLAIKILEALDIELTGKDYFKLEDLITDVIQGKEVEHFHLPYLKMYYRELVVDYLHQKRAYYNFNSEDIDDIVDDLMATDYIIDDYEISDIIDEAIEATEEEK